MTLDQLRTIAIYTAMFYIPAYLLGIASIWTIFMAISAAWYFRLQLSNWLDCKACIASSGCSMAPKSLSNTIRLVLPNVLIITVPFSSWILLSNAFQIHQGSLLPGLSVDQSAYPIILGWLTQIGGIPPVYYSDFTAVQLILAHGLVLAMAIWIFIGLTCLQSTAKIAREATKGALEYSSTFYLSRLPIPIMFLFIASLLLIFSSAYERLFLTEEPVVVGAILVVGSSIFTAFVGWIAPVWSVYMTLWLSSEGQ